MISADDLVELVRGYNPNTNADFLCMAYSYAAEAHEGQFRASGEPYFSHPVEVAAILTEQRLDDETLATALLHDTIEDTRFTYRDVETCFGSNVAQLVDGVTKLTNLEIASGENTSEVKQAENFRKLLLAMSKDLRVLLVKIADRLHNMRTIRALPVEKQIKKARETMDIYAPLAGRMGMQSFREELEDLSFRVLNPEARGSILRRFVTLKKETDDIIPQIAEDLRKVLEDAGIEADVFGREKRPYSIWRKMQEKKQPFSRLSDIYGFRIVTQDEVDAYAVLGAVHMNFSAVPGRFKDYISQPKSNGYRSIHTTVQGRKAKRVEIQIRTRAMHEVAETGVAAHWSYRDGERVENPFTVDPFEWIGDFVQRFESGDAPAEFLEHVKLEMFTDQVFCFTPKGEVIKLPRGATPLDFAYAIHTNIGDSCVGAKVDGHRVPLWTRLRNGQSVEIIRAEGQRPQPSWNDIVTTGRAKSAIRRSLKIEHREAHIRLGGEIARVALQRVGKKSTDKALQTAARNLALPDKDEVLARLGAAEMTGSELVRTLYPELLAEDESGGEETPSSVVGLGVDESSSVAPAAGPSRANVSWGLVCRERAF
jgi:RelA/SpoT family (p)ppGpp synthetase